MHGVSLMRPWGREGICSQLLPHSFSFPFLSVSGLPVLQGGNELSLICMEDFTEICEHIFVQKRKRYANKWNVYARLAEARHLMNSILINTWFYLKTDCYLHRYLPNVPWSSPIWPTCKKQLTSALTAFLSRVLQSASIHCSWRQGADPESRDVAMENLHIVQKDCMLKFLLCSLSLVTQSAVRIANLTSWAPGGQGWGAWARGVSAGSQTAFQEERP